MTDLPERRTGPRRRCTVHVTVSELDEQPIDVPVVAETVDLAVGGMRVHADRHDGFAGDPTVVLALPDGDVLVHARIVESDRTGSGVDYRLVFLDVDEATRAALGRFVIAGG